MVSIMRRVYQTCGKLLCCSAIEFSDTTGVYQTICKWLRSSAIEFSDTTRSLQRP